MNFLKPIIGIFHRIPEKTRVDDELYEARIQLLKAHDSFEYAEALLAYRKKQVERLTKRKEELKDFSFQMGD